MKLTITTCKRCLYDTDHPLGLTIDEEGICSGCRIHEEKDLLNWDERWRKLEEIVKPYRSNVTYDCIVPVTGSHDSYYILHLVKNCLNLNPLLVTYNKYFNTPIGIRNLANLRIKFNCDILIQNVNPLSVKKITRSTLRLMGSMYWPILAGQTVFPVQTAVRYKIPLIIWGAHQGLEQTGMFSHENEVEMTRRYRKNHDLMGYEAEDLITTFDTLTEADVWQYLYPDDSDLHSVGVRGIYLGNYVRWDPKAQHEKMIKLYDYFSATFQRTFDTYDYVDCYNYMNIHDLFKFAKTGYSKVTDHVTREIRHGRLSRNQGITLVKEYQSKDIDYKNLFCEWLNISPSGLDFMINFHRNPKFWKRSFTNDWKLKQLPFDDLPEKMDQNVESQSIKKELSFIDNSALDLDRISKYITIGKGWP